MVFKVPSNPFYDSDSADVAKFSELGKVVSYHPVSPGVVMRIDCIIYNIYAARMLCQCHIPKHNFTSTENVPAVCICV